MTDTHLLIGSLSNDLLRLATFTHNGSPSAKRFLTESKRWALPLQGADLPPHIAKIVQEINALSTSSAKAPEKCLQTRSRLGDPSTLPTLADGERYLMYSVLLQNFSLHNRP
ncbi:MAG: hypothetical protein UX62_C0044G0004 [Microgenomates group bacterium GW2011_GWA2_46_7]|nr:MAG: hypothetical protein UX62_C0044G0004 [Microgenomates group bacterium GW2011_GWA2_46_7]